jgi:hypothetical protein
MIEKSDNCVVVDDQGFMGIYGKEIFHVSKQLYKEVARLKMSART